MSDGKIGRDDKEVNFDELKLLTRRIVASTEALERSEAMFRASYEKSVTAMVLLQQDGSIISCNQSFTKLTGYKSKEIEHRSILEIIQDAPTVEATRFLVRSILDGAEDQYNVEKKIKTKDGVGRIVRISISCAFDGKEKIIFVLGVFEDITEITELRKRIKDLEDQLSKK